MLDDSTKTIANQWSSSSQDESLQLSSPKTCKESQLHVETKSWPLQIIIVKLTVRIDVITLVSESSKRFFNVDNAGLSKKGYSKTLIHQAPVTLGDEKEGFRFENWN